MKYLKFLILLLMLFPLKVWGYTKASVDITKMDINDISESLQKGYLTSELLVKLYIERIEEYDDDFLTIREINEKALDEARQLDEERKNGHIRSAIHGIPLLVKNNIDVFGMATTAGTKSLIDNYPKEDAEVIRKLKEAGAIILATTNMSEMAFRASESKSSYGNVGNAFNPLYSSYGSSGGSASGLALSFGAAALGTDTNASVRVPASAAGLVGLRPTYNLISTKGVLPYDIYRDTVGILTKTVNDNKMILEVIGYQQKEVLDNLNIGIINSYVTGFSNTSGVNGKTDEDILKLVNNVIELLKNAGENVHDIPTLLNNSYLNLATSTMTGWTFCDGFNNYIKNTTGRIRSFKEFAYDTGHIYSINGYLSECEKKINNNTLEKKEKFKEQIDTFMEDYDVLIYPTVKNKILKLGESELLAPGAYLGSVVGYPSITVPIGYIDGFPYGLEIFGTKESEDILYELAQKIESLLNLEIVNSPLAPNLYQIPKIVEDLKRFYENFYDKNSHQELNLKTKNFFLKYHLRTDKDNEKIAYELIEEYKKDKNNNKMYIYILGALGVLLSLVVICKIIVYGSKKIFASK